MIQSGLANVKLDDVLRQHILANKPKAQFKVDTQIMNDMVPYMPMQTGMFINMVRMRSASLAGTGVVCAATGVMGRYLYYGHKMVDALTGKGARRIELATGEVIFRYRKGAKLIPTGIPLNYNKNANPNAGALWYERAKEQRYQEWCKTARETLING